MTHVEWCREHAIWYLKMDLETEIEIKCLKLTDKHFQVQTFKKDNIHLTNLMEIERKNAF